MRVWRLARSIYPALDGEGARRYGGRWNAPGTPVVYTAETLSLAALELLVHLNPSQVPSELMAYAIEVSDGLAARRIDAEDLPNGWNRRAEVPELRRIGRIWADAGAGPHAEDAPLLYVPSAVIPEERNVLINPLHPDASDIHVVRKRPFTFDPRLFE